MHKRAETKMGELIFVSFYFGKIWADMLFKM